MGINLLIARKKKELTQKELGERIGVTKQTISNYERGIVDSPRISILMDLADELDVSVDYLLEDLKDQEEEEVEN